MKKKLLIILTSILLLGIIIILLITFIKPNPFYLDDEYYGTSSITEIDSDQLEALEVDKKSFIIFVYQLYCSTSTGLDSILNEFVNTYQISIYKIEFSSIQDTSISKYVKYCPSVVIYHEGEIVSYLNSNSNKDAAYFENIENFKDWFIKYVLLK